MDMSSIISFARGERALSWIAKVAWLLVCLMGSVVLLGVLGDFVARPVQPPLRSQHDVVRTAGQIAAVGLFPRVGGASRKAAESDFELLGVLSGTDAGAAILRRKGELRSKVFRAGADIPGGARLVRIDSDAVTLSQGLVETRLVLKRAPRARETGRPAGRGKLGR